MNSKVKYNSDIKLAAIAEHIIIVKTFETILEEIFTAASLINEEEDVELSSEEKSAMDKLIKTFSDELKKAASTVNDIANSPDKLEKIKRQEPDLAKLEKNLETEIEEGKLNEFAITASLVASIIAAIPSIIKIFGYLVKGIGFLLKKAGFNRAANKTKAFAKKIFNASNAVHHGYINVIKAGLLGMIEQLRYAPELWQNRIAEVVYMIIIIHLGIDAGASAWDALSHAEWIHGSVEACLAAIKGGDLTAWLTATLAKVV